MLDVAENSISAKAQNISIEVIENLKTDLLKLSVQDDGCGMSPEMVAKVTDPFITSRTTRKVGLGIPLLKEAAEACNGNFNITSKVGEGTKLSVQFQHSHIDRMPLGRSDYHAVASSGSQSCCSLGFFDISLMIMNLFLMMQPVKAELEGVSLSEPSILNCLREMLQSGINDARADHES